MRSPSADEIKCTHISIMDEEDLENQESQTGFKMDPSIPRMNIEDIYKRPRIEKSQLCMYKPS